MDTFSSASLQPPTRPSSNARWLAATCGGSSQLQVARSKSQVSRRSRVASQSQVASRKSVTGRESQVSHRSRVASQSLVSSRTAMLAVFSLQVIDQAVQHL